MLCAIRGCALSSSGVDGDAAPAWLVGSLADLGEAQQAQQPQHGGATPAPWEGSPTPSWQEPPRLWTAPPAGRPAADQRINAAHRVATVLNFIAVMVVLLTLAVPAGIVFTSVLNGSSGDSSDLSGFGDASANATGYEWMAAVLVAGYFIGGFGTAAVLAGIACVVHMTALTAANASGA